MASMASLIPPGLHRPSSWPIRHERRHAAVATFNAHVVTSLTQINEQLETLACTQCTLQNKFNGLETKIDTMLDKFEHIFMSTLISEVRYEMLENRVSSLELLLFGSCLNDRGSMSSHRSDALSTNGDGAPTELEPDGLDFWCAESLQDDELASNAAHAGTRDGAPTELEPDGLDCWWAESLQDDELASNAANAGTRDGVLEGSHFGSDKSLQVEEPDGEADDQEPMTLGQADLNTADEYIQLQEDLRMRFGQALPGDGEVFCSSRGPAEDITTSRVPAEAGEGILPDEELGLPSASEAGEVKLDDELVGKSDDEELGLPSPLQLCGTCGSDIAFENEGGLDASSITFIDHTGEFDDLELPGDCCLGRCTTRNILFARHVVDSLDQQRMAAVIRAVIDDDSTMCAFTFSSLETCVKTLLSILCPRQLRLLALACVDVFGSWSRGELRKFGVGKNVSQKGATGLVVKLGLPGRDVAAVI
jgi:hypothetical protein